MLLLTGFGAPLHAGTPQFVEPGPVTSDTGYAMIGWKADAPVTLTMLRNDDPATARTLYSGANSASFVSGLEDGIYTLTLRDKAGLRSAPLELTVIHQPLARALLLVAMGALIFLAIVATILRGPRDE